MLETCERFPCHGLLALPHRTLPLQYRSLLHYDRFAQTHPTQPLSVLSFCPFSYQASGLEKMTCPDPIIYFACTLLNGVQLATKHQTADNRNHTQMRALSHQCDIGFTVCTCRTILCPIVSFAWNGDVFSPWFYSE